MKYINITLILLFLSIFTTSSAQESEETFIVYRDSDSNLYSISSLQQTIIPLTAYQQSPIDQPRRNNRVTRYDISAQGFVVFHDSTDRAIYSVPIEGGEIKKLNTVQISSNRYYLSPNGTWIVFFGHDPNGELALFSVPVDGGNNANLSTDIEVESEIDRRYGSETIVRITPDSQNVVFSGVTGRGVKNLYITPIAGGTPIQLNGRLASGGNVEALEVTADGTKVIYAADQEADGVFNLYTVPITGGDAVNMTPDVPATLADAFGNIWPTVFKEYPFSPYVLIEVNSQLIVVDPATGEVVLRRTEFAMRGRADITAYDQLIFSTDLSLYAIDISETAPIEDVPVLFEDTRDHFLTPAGTSAISLGNDIKVVDLQSGTAQIIQTNQPSGHFPLMNVLFQGCTSLKDLLIAGSPDDEHIVYLSPDENGNYNYLSYSTSTSGESAQLNNFPGTRTFNAWLFRITADSQSVVYINDEEFAGFADLYLANIDGSNAVRLTNDNSRSVIDFKLYPQGTQWCFDEPFYIDR